MENSEKAIHFLRELGRADLAALLRYSTYQFTDAEMWFDITVQALEISSPALYSEALVGLPEWDQKRIGEAIVASVSGAMPARAPEKIIFTAVENSMSENIDVLYPEILIHRNQMIAVATGNGRIQDLNDYYMARHRRIDARLQELGILNPNPHENLWDWYHKWKADFPGYSDRRHYINEMYQPLVKRLVDVPPPPVTRREPTGWERVDRGVEKAHARLVGSKHEEDFQMVGLLCREVLISLGQAVYDPEMGSPLDGVTPSDTDAGRMIETYIVSVATGGSNESVRKHARASLQLAVQLQHKRTADFRTAALCLEATATIVNILAILSGRRDPGHGQDA